MNFRQKHQPASVHDLVFRDPKVAQLIADYADGVRTKHLLLAGPTSTGKSEAARMILKERLYANMGPAYSSIYHGQGFKAEEVKQIAGDWNLQMSTSGSACSVIDEVDFAGNAGCREIRKFIDSKSYGTLICTTNNLHRLEPAFVSRFRVVDVEPPLAADWHQRAVDILQSEGHPVTLANVQTLFASFTGHARNFMDLVEDAHITLQRKSKVQPGSNPSAAPLTVNHSAIPAIHLNGSLQAKAKVLPSRSDGQSKL